MIPSDKELIEALLSALENLYVETIVLRGQVRRAEFAGFHDTVDNTGLSAAASLAREAFQKRYAQAVRNQQQLKSFLENLPTSGIQ